MIDTKERGNFNMFDSNIVAVIPYIMNLDQEYITDSLVGNALRLTSVDSFNKKSEKLNGKITSKKNEKVWNGLQSEFFGTDFGDDLAFNERWSCKCKKYVGSMYKNKFCENCHTYVGFQDVDLKKFGWIIFDHFQIINPMYYEKMIAAFGKSDGVPVITKILDVKRESDKDFALLNEKEELERKNHPYIYKGMTWFQDHFWEVLTYYKKRFPTKKALFLELESEASNIFTHCLPVYSAVIRSEVHGNPGDKLFKMRVNTIWQTIIRLSLYVNKFDEDELDKRNMISINKALAAVMKEVDELFQTDIAEITSKNGLIITKIIGGRYNFSSRNVVICSSGRLRSDEIELGYLTFLELFRYEIQNLYTKMTGLSPEKANEVWVEGLTVFNPTLYKIMQHMVTDPETKELCIVFISRNPMINYGSGIPVHVASVKMDFTDKTMTIPSNLCQTTNGDFDGDMFNIYRIFGQDMQKRWSKGLNPRKNLYVSRMNNRVNKDSLPFKNELVGFWAFNNL